MSRSGLTISDQKELVRFGSVLSNSSVGSVKFSLSLVGCCCLVCVCVCGRNNASKLTAVLLPSCRRGRRHTFARLLFQPGSSCPARLPQCNFTSTPARPLPNQAQNTSNVKVRLALLRRSPYASLPVLLRRGVAIHPNTRLFYSHTTLLWPELASFLVISTRAHRTRDISLSLPRPYFMSFLFSPATCIVIQPTISR